MTVAASPERPPPAVTRLTGGRLVTADQLVERDLWVSSVTGKILHDQQVFYQNHVTPDEVVDLQGKILSPGFIDVQFNGAFGYDFSSIPEHGMEGYVTGLKMLNRHLVRTGVTSYLPTIPSNHSHIYHKTLPYLGPSGASRNPLEGSESLGAHVEGPFISPTKNGIHSLSVLRTASNGFRDIEACYGAENLPLESRGPITKITAGPEIEGMAALIPEFRRRGIIFSIGHTEATYEDVTDAVRSGATMITHLFNAMKPLHHRNPGPFGVLGRAEETERPYFGVICDGIHLHPTTVKIAYNAHKDGFIIVTDAMKTVGLPDGVHPWTNGDRFVKKGSVLTLEGSDRLAGSCATLLENVSNFWTWSGASIPDVIKAVTYTPAKMLAIEQTKGSLRAHADADLVVLDAIADGHGKKRLEVEQVWKFGTRVFDRRAESSCG